MLSLAQMIFRWRNSTSAEFIYDRTTLSWFVTGWACGLTLILIHLPEQVETNLKAAVAIVSLAILVLILMEVDNCLSVEDEDDYSDDETQTDNSEDSDDDMCYLDISKYDPKVPKSYMYVSRDSPSDLRAPLVHTFHGTKPAEALVVV